MQFIFHLCTAMFPWHCYNTLTGHQLYKATQWLCQLEIYYISVVAFLIQTINLIKKLQQILFSASLCESVLIIVPSPKRDIHPTQSGKGQMDLRSSSGCPGVTWSCTRNGVSRWLSFLLKGCWLSQSSLLKAEKLHEGCMSKARNQACVLLSCLQPMT